MGTRFQEKMSLQLNFSVQGCLVNSLIHKLGSKGKSGCKAKICLHIPYIEAVLVATHWHEPPEMVTKVRTLSNNIDKNMEERTDSEGWGKELKMKKVNQETVAGPKVGGTRQWWQNNSKDSTSSCLFYQFSLFHSYCFCQYWWAYSIVCICLSNCKWFFNSSAIVLKVVIWTNQFMLFFLPKFLKPQNLHNQVQIFYLLFNVLHVIVQTNFSNVAILQHLLSSLYSIHSWSLTVLKRAGTFNLPNFAHTLEFPLF